MVTDIRQAAQSHKQQLLGLALFMLQRLTTELNSDQTAAVLEPVRKLERWIVDRLGGCAPLARWESHCRTGRAQCCHAARLDAYCQAVLLLGWPRHRLRRRSTRGAAIETRTRTLVSSCSSVEPGDANVCEPRATPRRWRFEEPVARGPWCLYLCRQVSTQVLQLFSHSRRLRSLIDIGGVWARATGRHGD